MSYFNKFRPAELEFLVKTMGPVAEALDVLQGESSVQGWLAPTMTLLKAKFQHLCISSKFYGPLIDGLPAGLQKQVGQMLTHPEMIHLPFLSPNLKPPGQVIPMLITYSTVGFILIID